MIHTLIIATSSTWIAIAEMEVSDTDSCAGLDM